MLLDRKTKAEYVAVQGKSPFRIFYRPTFKHFDAYLIPMAEPCNKIEWKSDAVLKLLDEVLEERDKNTKSKLYIDSGGFQIILGFISPMRIREYIDVYHLCLKIYGKRIDKIFSLDINNKDFSPEIIKNYNEISTQQTIDAVKEMPYLKEKILYVLQNRNIQVFEIWRELFIEKRVWEHLDRFSIGGLVGLKRETRVDFAHAVPASLWLLTYAKHYNFKISQLHWLGQSSKIVFIMMLIFEKLFDGIYMTADSSEIFRFAPIASKMPLINKTVEGDLVNGFKEDFEYIRENEELPKMLEQHSLDDDLCQISTIDFLKKEGIKTDILHVVPQHLIDMVLTRCKGIKSNFDLCEDLVEFCSGRHLKNDNIIFTLLKVQDQNVIDFLNKLQLDTNVVFNEENIHLQKVYNNFLYLKDFKYKESRVAYAKDRLVNHYKFKKLDTPDHVECLAQHISNSISFGEYIVDDLVENLQTITVQEIKDLHPLFEQGRFAISIFENIQFIKEFLPIIESGDVNGADAIMRRICNGYIDNCKKVNDMAEGKK